MNLRYLIDNAALWLSGEDDAEGMVVSCRARLARNLSSSPFAPTATLDDQEQIIDQVLVAAQPGRQLGNPAFFKMNTLQDNERRLLVERHLISPALAESKGQRGVLHGTFQNCLGQPRKKSSFLPEDIFSLIFSSPHYAEKTDATTVLLPEKEEI